MAKITLPTITNGQDLTNINNNFQTIATQLNTNVFYRTNIGSEPNTLSQDVDFNGHAAYNLSSLSVNGVSWDAVQANAQASAAAALVSANNAEASNTAAASNAVSAATSATAAAASAAQAGTLKVSNNLSDVASVSASLTNLGLGNVNNTSDANKPVSTPQSTAFALKADLLSPSFTGLPSVNSINATVVINDTSGTGTAGVFYRKSNIQGWASYYDTDLTWKVTRYTSGGIFIDSPINISQSTGVVSLVDGISVDPIKGSKGTTTNNNAQAGSIGEVIDSGIVSGVAIAGGGVGFNITSIALTAGDWEIHGSIGYVPSITNTLTNHLSGSSATSATQDVIGTYTSYAGPGVGQINVAIPTTRKLIAGNTTIFLVGSALVSSGTCTGQGRIYARRIR